MNGAPAYKVDKAPGVKEQINEIAAIAKKAGKLRDLIALLEDALKRLQSDPGGWGDPEYRAKHVNAVYYHGMLRPLTIRYVVFEDASLVIVLNVRLIADFGGGPEGEGP